jgi:8-oxo-dGTP pyrophosphatase MutT (NUDIX family)
MQDKLAPYSLTQMVKFFHKAAITVGNDILLIRRSSKDPRRPSKWDLPGGNSHWPKHREDITNPHQLDVVREIKEEIGIDVSAKQVESSPPYFVTYFSSVAKQYTIICGWHLPLPSKPVIKLSHEHTEYTWEKLKKAAKYDFGQEGWFLKEIIEAIN